METEAQTRTKVRSALFKDKRSAELAYQAAINRGYTPEEITVIMLDETRSKYFGNKVVKTELGDKSMEGLALGGALGGTIVGVLAAVIALSTTIVIPGVGLLIAGPLAAGLIGAGAGSIAGGLIGALLGAGIPEERAIVYEKGLKEGGIVITVNSHSPSEDDALLQEWHKNKGADLF